MTPSFTDADLALVRERTSILNIVSEHVQLREAGGGNLKSACPFCNSPMLNVSPERELFHCFNCHTGGDAVTFTQQISDITFEEAVIRLAARVGLALN